MGHDHAVEERDAVSLFDELYRRHNRPVYAYLLGRCGDSDAAADLLQDTFLRAWRHLDDVRNVPQDRRRYWLLAVARNLAHDFHRRQAVRAPFGDPLPEVMPSADGRHDPVAATESGEQAAALDGAIARLPEELRLIICLRYLGEMSSAEIGEALGRPAGTVRYQLAKARALLAQDVRLQPECPGAGSEGATP
ncbi:MAG: sigma-70 family RNA polymerase sigma factor [Anaerolineae bacterium]|nr:sigma-70 family RNA polymerase sigma factor [Anaerolineae bacterium]